MEDDPVATGVLGPVKSLVGETDEIQGVGRLAADRRDAHAQGDADFLIIEEKALRLDELPDLLAHRVGAFKVRLGEDEGEFLTAVACEKLFATHPLTDLLSHLAQDVIACQVSEGVVELLEMVDVEERQGEVALVAGATGDLALEKIHKIALVVDLRQAVDDGHAINLFMVETFDIATTDELENGTADLDQIAVVEGGLTRDVGVVDEGAVGRAQILDVGNVAELEDAGMTAGDIVELQDDLVFRIATDRHVFRDRGPSSQITAVDLYDAGFAGTQETGREGDACLAVGRVVHRTGSGFLKRQEAGAEKITTSASLRTQEAHLIRSRFVHETNDDDVDPEGDLTMRRACLAILMTTVLTTAGCGGPSTETGDDAEEGAVRYTRGDGEGAELVLLNGKIVTLDDARPEVTALASDDGRIVALGTLDDVAEHIGQSTEVIDLEGRLAIPGFIESHAHFMSIGDAKIQLDLRQAATWDDIVAQVVGAVAAAEPGEWIRGRGWHQDKWTAPPEPNLEDFPIHHDLSAVSPENPVVLTHASGHAVFVNQKAMELAGIDAESQDPEGGEILKDADGEPTGLLRETAEELIQTARAASASPAELQKMVELASQECLQKGVTSFHDAGSSFETIDFLKKAAEDGSLGVRLWIMVLGSEEDLDTKLPAYKTANHADHRLAVGGIKLWLDGALGSRGAWLLEPYEDAPASTGLNTVSLEETRRIAGLAREHGYQLCVHAIGDRANREILDLYEEFYPAENPKEADLRWRVEHAQHLHPDDIPRFGELGVIAAMQAVHCTSDGPWVPDRLGEERSREGAYVWRDLLDSGAVVANGTDAPVEDVSPLASFYSAVSREMKTGEEFYPEQAMTRMEALSSYTLDAAYAAFEEDVKGSLEVGKLADVTVLSKDVLTIPEEEIPETEVVYTIVGGEVAWSAK